MNVRESFASRWKREIWRVGSPFRFVLSGGINALAGYLIYVILLAFFSYLVSYSIVYIVGILISYYLNSKFVFKQELKFRKALQYPIVYFVHYLLATISLYLLVQVFGVNRLLAPGLVILFTIPVTYFLSRRIIAGKQTS